MRWLRMLSRDVTVVARLFVVCVEKRVYILSMSVSVLNIPFAFHLFVLFHLI